ncbi:3-hydroxy-3-methylglutaryl-coenzyme A reductase [Gillisia mitskevichiae]|uniref:3-hydroxy-3-methylglutaryl coenzyme A reductase n=1 Tax=Gillisia mitskevichiae TaxID=270921 RepID=A0A495PVB6_9FLAO|nr:hydroxymethylglutaryl-CoA reductase, degradative [Gillisia mitskevichiae]RKS55092.1 3-hydroxy-3-methylglutaryl-coenzyme A reductase [Gillisia mitskevichiae]
MITPITGFSKLNKEEKINWLLKTYLQNSEDSEKILKQYWNVNDEVQQLHEEFTENTLSNFYLPFGIAPNFLINGKLMAIPMTTEESSVIAAASKAAKFWQTRGGFKVKVLNTTKNGQVHFIYNGDHNKLIKFFHASKETLLDSVSTITKNMRKRGGGVLDIELLDKTEMLNGYFQLHCTFETKDSMGANFINSCLEKFADTLKDEAVKFQDFNAEEKHLEVIMSILSNYVPECLVRVEVSCPVSELYDDKQISNEGFAEKFLTAIRIAEVEPYRAVTHNKGIMNGIDAVVLATGNDFRAIEAGIHAFACKDGSYTSLTHASIENNVFKFWMEVPLALGTVGGLTNLHPLVKVASEILQKPSARELMEIVAVAGLAQNFAAVKSLVTNGIQQGHMKMHLMNILNAQKATPVEKEELIKYFTKHTVTHSNVAEQLERIRN